MTAGIGKCWAKKITQEKVITLVNILSYIKSSYIILCPKTFRYHVTSYHLCQSKSKYYKFFKTCYFLIFLNFFKLLNVIYYLIIMQSKYLYGLVVNISSKISPRIFIVFLIIKIFLVSSFLTLIELLK